MNPKLGMQILRERHFIEHDHQKQRKITEEHTIKSNIEELSNLFICSRDLMPNLIVLNNSGDILLVLASDYVIELLETFCESGTKDERKYFKSLIAKMEFRELRIILVKIPNKIKLQKD